MSDALVFEALRSEDSLVVVEAPAGCGKTFQAASFAADVATGIAPGRVLILAHTHAAVDTFAERCSERSRVDIRTIDSLVVAIAAAYPGSVHVTGDVGAWARASANGYSILAARVATLLNRSPGIARMLAHRYPVVVCDEHQDTSADQHAIVMALHDAGARIRIFGDPMQALFEDTSDKDAETRWQSLTSAASRVETLDTPHRWRATPELGGWILNVRSALQAGRRIDLGSPPSSVTIVRADNRAAARNRYQVTSIERQPIDAATNVAHGLFVLAAHTMTVDALRAFFNRRFPIWEGHVRNALAKLTTAIEKDTGDPIKVAVAVLRFTDSVCTGFTHSAFGKDLLTEIGRGCTPPRKGKPAILQELGKLILAEPDHRGVAKFLRRLRLASRSTPAFHCVRIDYAREFTDAIALGAHTDVQSGLSEIARRRATTRSHPPGQAISTVHKAKGLERPNVLLLPCDKTHFPDTPKSRRVLYVAISRATKHLTLVVPNTEPSPLLII